MYFSFDKFLPRVWPEFFLQEEKKKTRWPNETKMPLLANSNTLAPFQKRRKNKTRNFSPCWLNSWNVKLSKVNYIYQFIPFGLLYLKLMYKLSMVIDNLKVLTIGKGKFKFYKFLLETSKRY